MDDVFYMRQAIELARKGIGFTSPNPLVGSVIVRDGRIIGQGYHGRYGDKHAEVEAIENAGVPVEGATLYCNLEPCCHTIPEKKTPPCSLRLIREKIARVVIANRDPNPHVNGSGIDMLRQNGIEVEVGVLAEEAARINEPYFTYISAHRPFIHLKIAQSLDGRIATSTGNSRWITNSSALKRVHQMRARYDAVLVGIRTVLQDDPSLTVRLAEGRDPFRVVLDENLLIPDTAKLLSDDNRKRTIIFTAVEQKNPRIAELRERGLEIITVAQDSHGFLNLAEVVSRLAEIRITSVLVEGGGQIFTSFIQQQLFDKISFFTAPIIIGAGIDSVNDLGIRDLKDSLHLEEVAIETIDHQTLVEGYRDYSFFRKMVEAG